MLDLTGFTMDIIRGDILDISDGEFSVGKGGGTISGTVVLVAGSGARLANRGST